ncbi:C45 family autoproteolytic acyltransferase/hydrolase [Acidobacteriota bacterium]
MRKTKPDELTRSKPVIREKELIRCGDGTLEKRKGVYIVHLKGSYEEMGWQHGKLAAEVCGDVVVSYFLDVVASLVKHTLPSLAGIVNSLLKWLFYTLNKKRIGRPLMDQIRGMADALGLSYSANAKGVFVPDILHFLIGKTFPAYIPVPPSCSGFMARGTATEGGKLIVGRNFDFFGQGVWDENNALIFLEPEEGQKFCWIGALGVPASGQGMNESGLIVSMYTKFNRDVRFTGIPLFTLLGNILQKCESVDDTLKLIAEQPRLCGLSLLVVDSKARDAAVAGFSANNMEIVRPEKDVLVRTNHYTSEKMKKFEVGPYPCVLHSTSRFNRIHSLLEEKRGQLTSSDVPVLLSDNIDFYENRQRLAGYIIRACNNSQSIAFSPDEDAMWIANGPFPVCTSEEYMGFRISALFNRERDMYEIEDLDGAGNMSLSEREAQKHFQEAWTAYFDNNKDDLAVQYLRKAEECAPEEPVFPRLAGFLLMKRDKFVQALPFMERNAAYEYKHDIMKAEALLWLGRCLDLNGMRNEALEKYRQASEIDVFPVSGAAKKHLNRPFKRKGLAKVSPEFMVGTVLAKY